VPVLVAEVARNDAAVLLGLSGTVAVVTDDASAVLILEAVAIAIFLSDSATAVQGRRESANEEEEGRRRNRDERDLRGWSVLCSINKLASNTRRNCTERISRSLGRMGRSGANRA
jgi:hypothetical protein